MDDDLIFGSETIRFEFGRLSLSADFAPPPVRLASPQQLAEAARAAPTMIRLAAFVDWVGTGRALNADGDLEPAAAHEVGALLKLEPLAEDADELEASVEQAEVQLVLEWAELAGLVYQRGSRLYRTRAGKGLDADTLAAWHAAFESLLELGVIDIDGNGPPWGSTLDDAMADLVVAAHLAAEPLPFDEVVEWLWGEEEELLEDARGDPELENGLREAIADDARRMCVALAAMGAVVVGEESVRCTPLGSWAAVRLMRDDGLEVSVVGEYAEQWRSGDE